jgi:tetratricopeptide (TPR) repeat protein
MLDDPKNTWGELCATRGIILAIRDSHERELEPWFLTPLEQRQTELTLLLRAKPLETPWPMENLDMQPQTQESLSALAHMNRQLLNCMAVVGMPVRESWVRDARLTENLHAEIGDTLVNTEAGTVLNASASAYFASHMTKEDREEAHFRCMQILDHSDVRLRARNPAIRILRLKHCLAARRDQEAVQECQAALAQMRELERPWRALEIGTLVDHLHRQFSPTVSLHLAWASIMTGDIALGSLRLKEAETVNDPLEKAWYHGLKAEVAKSRGSKKEALEEIELAIAILSQSKGQRDDHLTQSRLRAYRQDRVRILHYFCHEYALARTEYEKLLNELVSQPEANLLVAAVRRNYSECLRSLATSKEDTDWKRAKEIIDEEIARLPNDAEAPIFAELLYERARIALKEGDRTTANELLQRCQKAAERSHYEMIGAIAKARQFWEFGPFDLLQWKTIDSQLRIHQRHGWATRTAMGGRLRAAKRVETSQPAAAVALLRRNIADALANPGFDGKSDRDRIARSYAGLAALEPHVDHWSFFLRNHIWAKTWIEEDFSRIHSELWKGVE